MVKKIWNDPVGSKLIATAIIALVSQLAVYIVTIVKKITFITFYKSIYLYTLQNNNYIYIIILLSFLLLVLSIFSYRKRISEIEQKIKNNSVVKENSLATTDNIYLYKRKRYVAKRIYELREGELFSDTTINIYIESISDTPVREIHHRIVVNKKSEGNIKEMDFNFLGGTREQNGLIDHKILDCGTHILIWSVNFLPALKTFEKANYSYRRFLKVKQGTWEDIQKTIKYEMVPLFNHWEIKTATVTDKLEISVEFPQDYPISFPKNEGLYIVNNGMELPFEKIRVIKEGGFIAKYDVKNRRWQIEINVNSPMLGVSYGIAWVPPKKSEIGLK